MRGTPGAATVRSHGGKALRIEANAPSTRL